MIYKQMILPYFECAVFFLLISCNGEDKRDLQRCQNDALRICTRVRMIDHVNIVTLHSKCKIVSLEQRCRTQLLQLMYKKK